MLQNQIIVTKATNYKCNDSLTTTQLITPIITIRNCITFVTLLNTLPQVSAFKLVSFAGNWRTVLFVLFVETVIISVTNPILRDAMSGTWTSKLVICASLLSAGVSFIAAISTIVLRVTLPTNIRKCFYRSTEKAKNSPARYTSAIVTVELSRTAGHIHTPSFITKISTVVFCITFKG